MGDLSRNFDRSEFKCRDGCGRDTVDIELVKVLEEVRVRFARPIHISSGYRCHIHNSAIGGSKGSQHLWGRAADFSIEGVSPIKIAKFIDGRYGDRFGLGIYSSWVHIDTRSNGPARWG